MSSHVSKLSLALLLATAVHSQDPAAVATGDARRAAPLATCHDGDDVFGVGPDYLLRADADAVTFTPMLGANAPRSVPLTLRLLDARRGDELLPCSPAVRSDVGTGVVYEHGALRERYDLRADGVEQTFVFAQRPAGNGDLVVRLRVACPVAGVPAAGGGLRFVDGHGGGVTYGALLGVDAHGATASGSVQLRGDELQLRLPAAFVDDAAYPLTFDPLLGTASLANSTADDADPAVAWVAFPAEWLVVWRRVVAAGESHLIGQFVDPAMNANAPFVVSATAGLDVSLPRVGGNQAAAAFVVAWRSATGVFGTQPMLRLRSVSANGGTLGTISQFTTDPRSIAMADAAPGALVSPMVWGDANGQVRSIGLQFGIPNTLGLVSGGTLDASADPAASLAISRHSAIPARYVAVWTGGSLASQGISAGVIDANGTPIGPSVALTGPIQAHDPSLDGNGTTFLLAWHDANGEHVMAGVIGMSQGQSVPSLAGTPIDLATGATLHNGDVTRVGARYLVTYRQDTTLFDTSCRAQVTANDGTLIGPFAELVGPARPGSYDRQGTARLAARDALGGADDRMLAVFEEGQTVLPLDRDVVLQQLETIGAGGPITMLAQACGVGGICQAFGACAVGNSTFAIRLVNGDATAPVALLSLTVNPQLLPCGPCSLLLPDVLEAQSLANGTATRPFPIPSDPSLAGAAVAAQWLPAFGVPGPCNLFPFVSTSTAIRMEVGF